MRLLTTLRWAFLGTTTSLLTLSACGGEAPPCTTVGCSSDLDDAAAAAAGRGGSGGSGGSGSPQFIADGEGSGGTANSLEDGEACREVNFTSQASPVNVVILLDQSTSMTMPADPDVPGVSRWDAITAGLRAFVNSAQATDARVGLQLFGLMAQDDCGVEKYVTPAVPVAPLVDNRQALLQAIDAASPRSLTPTAPAVEGALTYALQVARRPENAEVPTVMILASDGLPTECGPFGPDGVTRINSFKETTDTLRRYSQPARDAAGNPVEPPIRTYIIGTRELENNADALAEAGNGQAFLVGGGTGDGGTLEAKFLDALLSIVVKPLSCEIDVPQTAPDNGEAINFDEVRVRFTGASSGITTEFPRTNGPGGCGVSNAWFYEAANPPTKIFFCPNACESLGAGDLKLELGCAPQIILQ